MVNMACVAYKYRMQKNQEIEECFAHLAAALDEIKPYLTRNAIFALRDAKQAAQQSGADGIRACGESLLREIEPCPLKTQPVTNGIQQLSELLFS